MSGRRTAILAAALAALLLYFALFEGFSVDRPAPAWERDEKILRCDGGGPSEIEVSGPAGRVAGKREGERWVSEAPGKYVAAAFADLAEALCRLPIIDRIEGPSRLADFGLEPPSAELSVAIGGRTVALLVGGSTPADNLMYLKLGDRPEVLKVGVEFKSDVDKVIASARAEGSRS